MEPKYEIGMKVKIRGNADFKYNNRRSGSVGTINDIYTSDSSGESILEVDMEHWAGYELIRTSDLEIVEGE